MKGGALLVRAATERVLLVVLSVNMTVLDLVAMVDLVVVVKLALYWYYVVEANRVVLVVRDEIGGNYGGVFAH